jgi:o-succinylbenzoate synthase
MKTYNITPYQFTFKQASGTSRGILTHKKSWFISLQHDNGAKAWGECSIIEGLSPDYKNDVIYRQQIDYFCKQWLTDSINSEEISLFPSIQFGLETAVQDLATGSKQHLFDTPFSRGEIGIPINGLVWMGTTEFMQTQINEKIAQGFSCIKLKIGALEWKQELEILTKLRNSNPELEIRVDANGAFTYDKAQYVLDELANLSVHSIEQPIRAGQIQEMARLCEISPCPIALDEELIGITTLKNKESLISTIRPHYIILKPSLIGGFSGMSEWIKSTEAHNIPWWATSALESNIGLNAIAQFTSTYNNPLPQGFGTGGLYTENIPSPLYISEGEIFIERGKGFGNIF